MPSFHSVARNAANAALCRSSSAQLKTLPKLEYAGRCGWCVQACSNIATMDANWPASISTGTPGG